MVERISLPCAYTAPIIRSNSNPEAAVLMASSHAGDLAQTFLRPENGHSIIHYHRGNIFTAEMASSARRLFGTLSLSWQTPPPQGASTKLMARQRSSWRQATEHDSSVLA